MHGGRRLPYRNYYALPYHTRFLHGHQVFFVEKIDERHFYLVLGPANLILLYSDKKMAQVEA